MSSSAWRPGKGKGKGKGKSQNGTNNKPNKTKAKAAKKSSKFSFFRNSPKKNASKGAKHNTAKDVPTSTSAAGNNKDLQALVMRLQQESTKRQKLEEDNRNIIDQLAQISQQFADCRMENVCVVCVYCFLGVFLVCVCVCVCVCV